MAGHGAQEAAVIGFYGFVVGVVSEIGPLMRIVSMIVEFLFAVVVSNVSAMFRTHRPMLVANRSGGTHSQRRVGCHGGHRCGRAGPQAIFGGFQEGPHGVAVKSFAVRVGIHVW